MADSDISGRDDLFALALDLAPSAIVVVDQDGRIVLINKESERLFGYPRDELLGEHVERLVPERFRATHPERRAHFLDAPEARPMGRGRELYALRKDGGEVPVEIGLNPVTTRDGTLVVTSVLDLSERRRAEARFRAAVESSPSGVLMVDAGGTIVLANREAERTFGYDDDELLGMSIDRLVPQRFSAEHPGHRQSYLHDPEARPMGTGRELYGVRKDGAEIPVEVGLTPITTGEGTFVLASVVDISLRRGMEDQLREAQRLETVGALASGVAHDFNNVLLAILGYSELVLEDADLNPALRDDMSQIVRAAERGRHVVERMLAIGRQRRSEAAVTDLHGPVGEALELLQASLLKSADVRVHLDTAAPAVLCDSTQLHQIVMNLVSNAAHAMPGAGGVLDVSVVPFHADAEAVAVHPGLQPGLYARLTIADNGVGIPADMQERVFSPFVTSRASGEGTGLGLWLVRETVQSLRGIIELKSREGEGTTFDIFLPAAHAGQEVDAGSSAGAGDNGRPNIVYVEDEATLAELGRRRLEAAGFQVTAFTSSVRALEDIRSRPQHFDLLVTDNTMPRLSGMDLAQEVVRIRPGLPVLMVSGLANVRVEDLPDCITRVLQKPHTSEELVSAARELLER
ncbi:MAG: PAS domain S-box protein [Gammaproteobacteria bacterium]|nr:PAS domain S-box protein [Gammaproteobacteria bacterium]